MTRRIAAITKSLRRASRSMMVTQSCPWRRDETGRRGNAVAGIRGRGSGCGVAEGKECRGVSLPDHVQVDGSRLTLNGLGLRQATTFKVNVYIAALYVVAPTSDPVALVGSIAASEPILQFVRDVGAEDLRKGGEGFGKNANDQLPALK